MQPPLLPAAVLTLMLTAGCAGLSSTSVDDSTLPPARAAASTGLSTPGHAPGPVTSARTELAALRVATPHSMTGYSREKFDIWAGQPDHCTTRQEVLKLTGRRVVERPGSCQPSSGTWYSAYDGKTVTAVAQATIDHMVPLAEAWRSGADRWPVARRRAFGNDLADPQLVIASESTNSAKGDSGPADWKPVNHAVWCAYAEDYIYVKHRFRLTSTSVEKNALARMLDTCR